MAAEAPNSYRDPYWSNLAGTVEAKLELPKGLLAAIVSRGERSNADQVSEAGAKTPFQIIPATRKAAIDKFGIDPYLSPENAAEVAGLLLKDSLQRNKGDAALAVAEYHGGTDRANWGARTRSYVQRVTGAIPSAVADAGPIETRDLPPTGPAGNLPDGGQSTFDRLSAQTAKPTEASIASVLQAYQGGQMSPQEAKQFETDVNAGRVMLPRGASLAPAPAAAARAGAPELPPAVLAAYQSGQMTGAERAQLEADVKGGAVRLPQGTPPTSPSAPGAEVANLVTGGQYGNAETAATLGTGILAAPIAGVAGLGTAAGNALGLTDREPADVVRSVQGALTYVPRTEAGKSNVALAAAPFEALAHGADVVGGKVADVTGSPALGAAANTGIQMLVPGVAAKGVARALPAIARAAEALKRGPDPLAMAEGAPVAAVRPAAGAGSPTPGTLGSVGAAGTDLATQRRVAAADLPHPLDITEGMATRDFAQQQFERETAKNADVGAPLRQRFDELNARMAQNIDHFIDQTGAEAPNLRATGVAVDDAVNAAATRDKVAIRVAYKEAEKAGEMQAPVSLATVVQHLSESAPEATTAPILTTARALALKLGIAEEGEGGALIPHDVTLNTAEQFRKAINRATNAEPTNIRQASIIRGLVDDSTAGAGGELYAQARALRSRFAQNYENHAVIADILKSKRGTTDRAVALEDIHKRTILDGSLDDVREVRRVLQRSGPQGQQAWRELQGQTLQHIKDQAFGNAARDSSGNPILSAAKLDKVIRSLDSDGKLDFIFGRRGAEQLRTVNDVAKDVYTSPPGSVNTSNTASVLAGLLDLGMTSFTGLPIPVASGARYMVAHLRDRRLAARVTAALNGKAPPPQAIRPAPRPIPVPASSTRN